MAEKPQSNKLESTWQDKHADVFDRLDDAKGMISRIAVMRCIDNKRARVKTYTHVPSDEEFQKEFPEGGEFELKVYHAGHKGMAWQGTTYIEPDRSYLAERAREEREERDSQARQLGSMQPDHYGQGGYGYQQQPQHFPPQSSNFELEKFKLETELAREKEKAADAERRLHDERERDKEERDELKRKVERLESDLTNAKAQPAQSVDKELLTIVMGMLERQGSEKASIADQAEMMLKIAEIGQRLNGANAGSTAEIIAAILGPTMQAAPGLFSQVAAMRSAQPQSAQSRTEPVEVFPTLQPTPQLEERASMATAEPWPILINSVISAARKGATPPQALDAGMKEVVNAAGLDGADSVMQKLGNLPEPKDSVALDTITHEVLNAFGPVKQAQFRPFIGTEVVQTFLTGLVADYRAWLESYVKGEEAAFARAQAAWNLQVGA